MNDNKSLALRPQQSLSDLIRIGEVMAQSGYFQDSKSAAQAIVKVLAGAEIGIGPFASMTGIHIIQGKPAIGANIIATLIKNDSRYDYRVRRCDAEACEIEFFEQGQSLGTAAFTMKEGQAAGLTNKDNWRKFPSDMLFARCITRGARRFTPGVFGGAPVYTPEELGADMDTEAGDVVDAEMVGALATLEPATAGNGAYDPPPAAMKYLDGKLVNQSNDREVGTFLDYQSHTGKRPESRKALKEWTGQ